MTAHCLGKDCSGDPECICECEDCATAVGEEFDEDEDKAPEAEED